MNTIKNAISRIKNQFWNTDTLYPLSAFLMKKLFFTYFFMLLLITGIEFAVEYKISSKTIQSNLDNLAKDFDPGITSLLWNYQEPLLQDVLKGLTNNSNVTYVAVLDDYGLTIFSWPKTESFSSDIIVKRQLLKDSNGEKKLMGTLILGSDKKLMFSFLIEKYRNIFLTNISLLLVVMTILALFSRKYLTKPLGDFVSELKKISTEDAMPILNLNNIEISEIYQLKNTTNLLIQEIFVLKDSLNVLVQDLTETQDIIIKQNETLEIEIEKRTKEVIEKELEFRSIFEQSNVAIVIVDTKGTIADCNESYLKFLEYDNKSELIGLNFNNFTHPEDIESQLKLIKNFISGKSTKERMEKRYITKHHKILWADLSATVIRDENNRITNFMAIIVDITERKKNETELNRLYNLALDANPLTGLPGNNTIRKHIETILAQKEKYCVIYGDLDNFKAYNDIYGFAMGDKILIHVAKIFQYVSEDLKINEFFLGHIGGDDFVIIIPTEYINKYTKLVINDMEATIGSFYNKEDFTRGYIKSFNRQGEAQDFPFVSISMAGINLGNSFFSTYLEINDALSLAKKQAKKIKGNSFYLEEKEFT